jgi:hypothetical protein
MKDHNIQLKHKLVEVIPEILEDSILYISLMYEVAIHKCCCGCGLKVVTPLNPQDWTLTIDGEAVTLSPSIGNFQFPCKSHYWIRNSMVVWAI